MKPILFNTEMVKAILEGRKTQTRRVVKGSALGGLMMKKASKDILKEYAPYKVNDILYVRETWTDHYVPNEFGRPEMQYCYRADGIDIKAECLPGESNRWYPSIHMPKEAARIFLKITNIKIERLQDMRLEDFKAEGIAASSISPDDDLNYRFEFINIWDSTLKKDQISHYEWEANPYVWVIEFEVLPCSSITEAEKLEVQYEKNVL